MICDLSFLSDEFKPLAENLIWQCKQNGVMMTPMETLRSPFLQATYWCQSRSEEEIQNTIKRLLENEAPFLAACLSNAERRSGPRITNALPGYSWHQWGEAMDCFWEVNGKACWDMAMLLDGINGYYVYATEAKMLGLEAGYFWVNIKDGVHVQLRSAGSPFDLYGLKEINDCMEYMYT